MSDTASKTIPLTVVRRGAAPSLAAGREADRPATRSRARRCSSPTRRCCASRRWIRVRIPSRQLGRQAQGQAAREPPGHGVRGSQLPEHPRVLQPRHRDLHDPRRGLHAPLLVLRRRPRPPEAAGCRANRATWRRTIADMGLNYVVDHLASTATTCATAAPSISSTASPRSAHAAARARKIEILTPDFRGKGRMDRALEILRDQPAGRVQPQRRDGAATCTRTCAPAPTTHWSLTLLQKFKAQHPDVPTKSGIMLGLGETMEQVQAHAARPARARRRHDHHRPVPAAQRRTTIRCCATGRRTSSRRSRCYGMALGFTHVASGPAGALVLPRRPAGDRRRLRRRPEARFGARPGFRNAARPAAD